MKNNLLEKQQVWIQPENVNSAYRLGEVVLFEGRLYKSLVSNNGWQPSLAMWELCAKKDDTKRV